MDPTQRLQRQDVQELGRRGRPRQWTRLLRSPTDAADLGPGGQDLPLDSSLHMLHQMPNAQLHVFPNCGHWCQVEPPPRFERQIIDFLSRRLNVVEAPESGAYVWRHARSTNQAAHQGAANHNALHLTGALEDVHESSRRVHFSAADPCWCPQARVAACTGESPAPQSAAGSPWHAAAVRPRATTDSTGIGKGARPRASA